MGALTHERRSGEVLTAERNRVGRRDRVLAPGAVIILHNLFVYQFDLRFDYHYQHNHSTDPTRLYINHLFTVASVARF